jgi:glyoxylase-like metal-dependent hydrolase (beta-lactamase superfamily II)
MNSQIQKMEKTAIRENLYRYYFVENDGAAIHNIFVCVDNTGDSPKALVLDTAFPEYAEMVKKDLETNGIKPGIIVLSHHHPDHAGGCSVFPGIPIYASRHYEANYENCIRWKPDLTFIRPTHTLKDGDTMSFGAFQLKFMEAPGHSRCSLMTLINDDVLHIGDLLMYDAGPILNLPYISMGGSYKQYIDTLQLLKTIEYKTMLIAHGTATDDRSMITDAIDDYIYYLEKVLDTKGTLPLPSCLKKNMSSYAHPEYHDNNLFQLMMG